MEHFGHIVGRGELKAQDNNIRELKEASPPRCKKDLRSFLGMCNVFRRFVKDYAQCRDSKIVPLSYSHNTGVNDPGEFKLIVQHFP